MNQLAETSPYRISRTEYARVCTLVYIKSLWFILAGIPIAGILLIIFIHSTFSVAFGIVFVFWPLTIPGRVLIVTWKKSSQLAASTSAIITEDALYIARTDQSKGTKIPHTWIRKMWVFGDVYILEGYRLKFVAIRKSSLDNFSQKVFESTVNSWIEANRQGSPEPPTESSPN